MCTCHALLARSHLCFVPETTAKAQLIVGLGTMAFSHTEATARAVATLASFVTLSLPLHCH